MKKPLDIAVASWFMLVLVGAGMEENCMDYRINELAKMAGVSARTLRYYDQIELLSPRRMPGNDYRVYGPEDVDRLQQILFYRELGMSLDVIARVMQAKGYDCVAALDGHLAALRNKQKRLDRLIATVEKTIAAKQGEIVMDDQEKFEGFRRKLVEDNEALFGAEIREKYGEAGVDAGNARMMGLSLEEYGRMQALSARMNDLLKTALEQGDPASPLAQQVCDMHRQWLGYTWPQYSKEAHLNLGRMYVDDPRFRRYYDAIEDGCAQFLYEALQVYCR